MYFYKCQSLCCLNRKKLQLGPTITNYPDWQQRLFNSRLDGFVYTIRHDVSAVKTMTYDVPITFDVSTWTVNNSM